MFSRVTCHCKINIGWFNIHAQRLTFRVPCRRWCGDAVPCPLCATAHVFSSLRLARRLIVLHTQPDVTADACRQFLLLYVFIHPCNFVLSALLHLTVFPSAGTHSLLCSFPELRPCSLPCHSKPSSPFFLYFYSFYSHPQTH